MLASREAESPGQHVILVILVILGWGAIITFLACYFAASNLNFLTLASKCGQGVLWKLKLKILTLESKIFEEMRYWSPDLFKKTSDG